MTNLRTPDPLEANQTPSRWLHARHVDLLDEILVNLCAGEYRKQGFVGIIVEEPPRHGKSELCSHYLPAWYLDAKPDDRVMLASYEAEFAASWGGKVRDLFQEFGGGKILQNSVSKKSSATDRWNLEGKRGGMFTAGARGPLTGRGGQLLIIDDPVKNMEEAQSETMREKTWQWYKSTFRTRLEPGGVILIIMTRWHEDDLVGRILAEMEEDPTADKFKVIRLPAIAEEPDEDYPEPDPLGRAPGEPLFPERWPVPLLVPHMSNIGVWEALFQQRPSPKEGGLFSRDDLPIVPYPSGKFKRIIRRWDLAATEADTKGSDPDWTVGLKLGLHEDGSYYVLDVVRFREEGGKLEKHLRATALADTPRVRVRVEQEPGSQGKLYIRHLGQRVFRGFAFRGIRSTGDKYLRAEKVAGEAERGGLKIVRGPWNKQFIYELTRFNNAAHDDQVDALSGAYEDLTARTGKMWTA